MSWILFTDERPPPNSGSTDTFGCSIDVLVWKRGMTTPVIAFYDYEHNWWRDVESMGPWSHMPRFTHWHVLPPLPT